MNKIKLVVTDSGLGGLSIFSEIYEKLKSGPLNNHYHLIFVNALPETGQGYNKMSGENQKIRVFNSVLNGIEKHFSPDLIAIACNTLSVLLKKTEFYSKQQKPVLSIVEGGIDFFIENNQDLQSDKIIIYGTETTILSGLHKKLLLAKGIDNKNVFEQACPNLASEIEKDYQSYNTRSIINNAVKNATREITDKKDKIYIFLACTHYGFVKDRFLSAHHQSGFENCEIINPNQSMVMQIMDMLKKSGTEQNGAGQGQLKLEIYSRCQILPEEINSISGLLKEVSLDTIHALQNYVLKRDLFEE